MSSAQSTPRAASADFPPEQAVAANSNDTREPAQPVRLPLDLGPLDNLLKKPKSSKSKAPTYSKRSGSARSHTPEASDPPMPESGVLPGPAMGSSGGAERLARAAAERRMHRQGGDQAHDDRFVALTPRDPQPAPSTANLSIEKERRYHDFHRSILSQLRAFGVDFNELKVLYRQLGNTTELTRQLSATTATRPHQLTLFGADVVTGERCPFVVSTSMVPFYLATTVCMALVVVRKIPVADLYEKYTNKIDEILTLSADPDQFHEDIVHALCLHARTTRGKLAAYHTLLKNDTNNVTLARYRLELIFNELFQHLESCRRVIVQKAQVVELTSTIDNIDAHFADDNTAERRALPTSDFAEVDLGEF